MVMKKGDSEKNFGRKGNIALILTVQQAKCHPTTPEVRALLLPFLLMS